MNKRASAQQSRLRSDRLPAFLVIAKDELVFHNRRCERRHVVR